MECDNPQTQFEKFISPKYFLMLSLECASQDRDVNFHYEKVYPSKIFGSTFEEVSIKLDLLSKI